MLAVEAGAAVDPEAYNHTVQAVRTYRRVHLVGKAVLVYGCWITIVIPTLELLDQLVYPVPDVFGLYHQCPVQFLTGEVVLDVVDHRKRKKDLGRYELLRSFRIQTSHGANLDRMDLCFGLTPREASYTTRRVFIFNEAKV